jgi:deoxyribonuclease-2
MGNLISCFSCTRSINVKTVLKTDIKLLAIKLPKKTINDKNNHGLHFIEYCENKKDFIKKDDINVWINNLYMKSRWTNWIIYNDDIHKIKINKENNHGNGHCKGILTWNDTNISWLCHSVPNFPLFFDGVNISNIDDGELIYGQSFQYIELAFSEQLIKDILNQINIMNAHIYIENNNYKNINFVKNNTINEIKLTDTINHIAKSPHYEIDIYSEYIGVKYNYKWNTETWIRGHNIEKTNKNIINIKSIIFEDIEYNENQDHSKWAFSDNEYYWIGDLNRMTSQYRRGGGGFICKDINITKALKKLKKI